MDKELAQLRTLLEQPTVERKNGKDFILGNIGSKKVVLQKCGIGKVNSAIGAVEMIDNYHPDLVVSSGCAGGADTSLNVTDVVVSTECCYHDAYCGSEQEYGQIMGMPARFASPQELVAKAAAMEGNIRVVPGLIVSGEWFVDSRDKMRSILDHFPEAKVHNITSFSFFKSQEAFNIFKNKPIWL